MDLIFKFLSWILNPIIKFIAHKDIERLNREKSELEDKLRIQGEIYYKDNMYWAKEDSNLDKGPYCSKCYDEHKILIHLHDKGHVYQCQSCKTYVHKDNRDLEPVKPTSDSSWFD